MRQSFSRLMWAHGANALSIGIQLVMISWLAADALHLTPLQIGWVQAAVLAPNVLLLPLAGVISDRTHPAKMLCIANAVMTSVHLCALVVLWHNALNFVLLLVYGFWLGCCNSFIQSAREKLIASMKVKHLHGRISRAGLAQHSAQALGIALCGLSDWIGWEALTALQATLCGIASVLYGRILLSVSVTRSEIPKLFQGLRDGAETVWQHVAVRHTVAVVAFNGLMHLGMLMVLLPIYARDEMQFRSWQFSALQLSFAIGGMVVQWLILRRRIVQYPGQAVMFCVCYAGVLALVLSYQVTVFGLFSVIFLWGCVSGASANLGRLVVQSGVPPSHRGRAMALYQLALFGSAPLGALLAGYIVGHGGLQQAFRLIAWSSFAVFFLSFLTRALWDVSPANEVAKSR